MTVLLDGEASRSDIHEFRTALKGERYVYALDYVSKEQALKEQVKAMGSDPSEFLGANPFTASFELRMNALYANSDSLAWITAKLKKKNPLVEDVMYQKELVDTVNDNLRRISYVLLGLAVLFGLGLFCTHQQYRAAEHLFRPFRYPYDEIGRGELGIYPEAVYGTEFQSRVPVRSVGRCRVVGRRAYPFCSTTLRFPNISMSICCSSSGRRCCCSASCLRWAVRTFPSTSTCG